MTTTTTLLPNLPAFKLTLTPDGVIMKSQNGQTVTPQDELLCYKRVYQLMFPAYEASKSVANSKPSFNGYVKL